MVTNKFGDFLQMSKLTTLTLCSGVLKRNVILPSNGRINNGNNASTLRKKLARFGY